MRPALLLLDVKKGRWDFPELKRQALKEYEYWEPDTVIIEAKASGLPLTHEPSTNGHTSSKFYARTWARQNCSS